MEAAEAPAIAPEGKPVDPTSDPKAAVDLARRYLRGEGVATDPRKARDLVSPHAEAGHPEAQALMGYLSAQGLGTPKDDLVAIRWFRKAADQGNSAAQFNLGMLLLAGKNAEANLAESLKGISEALNWLEAAANQGNLDAQLRLADLFYFGSEGIEKDRAKALPWARRAAESGNRWAQQLYGNMLEWGEGGLKADRSLALVWYRKAAEQGDAKAQSSLGRILAGSTEPADELEAYVWLRLSAEQKEQTAINYIKEHIEALTDEQINEGNRLYLKKKAELESRNIASDRS